MSPNDYEGQFIEFDRPPMPRASRAGCDCKPTPIRLPGKPIGDVPAVRRCLGCSHFFDSDGFGNRICRSCEKRPPGERA